MEENYLTEELLRVNATLETLTYFLAKVNDWISKKLKFACAQIVPCHRHWGKLYFGSCRFIVAKAKDRMIVIVKSELV